MESTPLGGKDGRMTTTTTDEQVSALTARLRVLEDERAVLQTLYAYGHAIDYGHEDDWVGCFTDDGVFDVRMRKDPEISFRAAGRDELAAFISQHTRAPSTYHKHVLVEPRIVVDGNSSTVESYFMKVDAQDDARSQIVAIGRYRDRLQRGGDGRWRFQERIAEVEDM